VPAFARVTQKMPEAVGPPVFVCLTRPSTGAVGGTTATGADEDGLLALLLPANAPELCSEAHCSARCFVGNAFTVRAAMGACEPEGALCPR